MRSQKQSKHYKNSYVVRSQLCMNINAHVRTVSPTIGVEVMSKFDTGIKVCLRKKCFFNVYSRSASNVQQWPQEQCRWRQCSKVVDPRVMKGVN